MNINLDDVKSVKLPTEPGPNVVTVVMNDSSQQVLRGAEATQFLTDWNAYQKKKAKSRRRDPTWWTTL